MKHRNFVQKNMKINKGGVHEDKDGKFAPRHKQKQKYQKDIVNQIKYLNYYIK